MNNQVIFNSKFNNKMTKLLHEISSLQIKSHREAIKILETKIIIDDRDVMEIRKIMKMRIQ